MKSPDDHELDERRTANDATSDSKVIFEDDRFAVTRDIVRDGSRTWPVSTIVKVTDFKKPFGVLQSVAIGVALLFALFAMFQFTLFWIAIGLAITVFCAKHVRNVFKNQYIVCIEFDSGEKEKILTSQQGVAFRLRDAIRAAIGS